MVANFNITKMHLLLIIGDAFEDGEIRLPHNIRWFSWDCCPYEMLKFHDSQHGQLSVLLLHGGLFRNLGSHIMVSGSFAHV